MIGVYFVCFILDFSWHSYVSKAKEGDGFHVQ